jgi:hypothetical protein
MLHIIIVEPPLYFGIQLQKPIPAAPTQHYFIITGTNENGQEIFSMKFTSVTTGKQYIYVEGDTIHQANSTLNLNLEVRYSKDNDPKKSVNADSQKIAEKNLAMLNDPKYSDFTCIAGDRKFKVHKNILGAASPVFDRMFSTAMAEAQTNKAKIDAIDPNIFEHLLRFIYAGKLPENLTATAVDLFKAAHYYEIELKEICEDEIEETLSIGNAIQFYELAYVYDMKVLKADAWQIIKR